MGSAVRRVARLVVVVATLASACPAPSQPTAREGIAGEQPQAGLYPEVRLRKLHLVRPDLIPYPIAYEVCC